MDIRIGVGIGIGQKYPRVARKVVSFDRLLSFIFSSAQTALLLCHVHVS